jgi:putative transposase
VDAKDAGKRRATGTSHALIGIADAAWAEAVRREAVIRPLCAAARVGEVAIGAAARALGLSASRIYALINAFRLRPVTTSLLPEKSGPARGSRRLAPGMEVRIDAAIETVYLTRERPSLTP